MEIGKWHVDTEARTLSDGLERVSLTPRSWDVLMYLVAHEGHLVTTRTLLETFWDGTNSDEAYVRKAIVEIRRALGDPADTQKIIRTIPKQGYLLRASSPPRAVVAVLPFVNISDEPENEHFCDGLSEEILNHLTQNLAASVVSRTSSFQFKGRALDIREIGALLSASHILEGSVRSVSGTVRITAQLIDAGSGAHLWSQTYERPLDQVFSTQVEVAEAIGRAVRKHVPGSSMRTVVVSERFTTADEFQKMVRTLSNE